MAEYMPILILGAIIGVFTVIFLVVFALEKNKKHRRIAKAMRVVMRAAANRQDAKVSVEIDD